MTAGRDRRALEGCQGPGGGESRLLNIISGHSLRMDSRGKKAEAADEAKHAS